MTEHNSFFDRVYAVTRMIPPGRVTSYGAIARYLGSGRSARMVGWALNKCHTVDATIPAHRVVNRNGLLTGKHHFSGRNIMRQLLESEGVRIENDCVVHFQEIFWDPARELRT